ncbi:methylmalonyl Co-A mutase-associated GTPase MeaB [Niallia endozanthoxylica]|uniref:Methylmalonyl Co-A mutase-associated GTPase MeaB n=1 Tax=Niallia endozanthoxylica TaxID=2036016 RepID=A0A5J5HX70_9BACI|nr:methylmalonyl Co-A mutase-associated GTPase MeaB [Niallia endozanthoxylica]KAA9026228.1 methylmalonyl Co-A mutase-associated GTPase MeaB [Niallia endozanthoxylica]
MSEDKRPEWVNQDEPDMFSTSIRKGVEAVPQENLVTNSTFRKKKTSVEITCEQLAEGVLNGDRSMLARSITLIESNAEHHFQKAQTLLQQLLAHTGRAVRIGITGVPGAGKSTFIEAFGMHLCNLGLRVAVLAVDPSSSRSGGSILGDKTRMEQLGRNPRAFIRPSPSGGKLGGVHRKTRETMLLCEAYGFDVILIETVGVGQSEVIVRDMVDFFMLIVLTGAGDELQGMKKGIMELADAIVINKADGENKATALKTKKEYNQILHFLQQATKGWETKACTCSALMNDGIKEIWDMIQDFESTTKQSGVFADRRRSQIKEWMKSMIIDQLQNSFFHNKAIKELLPKVENQVISGNKTVTSAVEELFEQYFKR